MNEQKTNYIKLPEESNGGGGNIFNEISGELGDFDANVKKKSDFFDKDWLAISYKISGALFITTAVISVLFSVHVFVRTSADNSLYASLPICPYLSWGVENYENEECNTLSMIATAASEERQKNEKTLIDSLVIMVPQKIQSLSVLNSPKVRFIQEHTWDSRIAINAAVERFLEIKNNTDYKWEDIECTGFQANEKGELSLTCTVYGWALFSPTKTTTHTSREVALKFLGRLNDPKQWFQLLDIPKTLGIEKYSSTEASIKSVFSTSTTLNLKLRYLFANKM